MFIYLSLILSFCLGTVCAETVDKKLELLKLLVTTFINSLLEKKLTINEVTINDSHWLKYSNVYLHTFTFHHHYDIFCVSEVENIKFENLESHNVKVSKSKKIVPINFLRYKDKISHTIFKPSNLNFDTLYICIRRITFNEYSVYKFEKNDYVDLENIIEKYEEYLTKPETFELAEAYD